jgi:hypothetical protein
MNTAKTYDQIKHQALSTGLDSQQATTFALGYIAALEAAPQESGLGLPFELESYYYAGWAVGYDTTRAYDSRVRNELTPIT